ncbi:MAG: hypothetical protein KDB27_27235 [Planctomycetales bacterium]|nr:hypothetical protein [Planctomycetales bacterium]
MNSLSCSGLSRRPLHVLLALFLQSSAVLGQTYFNGVPFFGGDASFADEIISFDPLFSGGPAPFRISPEDVLGRLDRTPFLFTAYQALGHGGAIELGFNDYYLTNDGTDAVELYIGEVQGSPEAVYISLRPTAATRSQLGDEFDLNGDTYFEVGRYAGESYLDVYGYAIVLDVDDLFPGYANQSLFFDAVQIIDDPQQGSSAGDTVGMDLESVGVIYGQFRGDFNKDQKVTVADVTLLAAAIRRANHRLQYDLDNDGLVNGSDMDVMIHSSLQTYYGDANLDGEFNSQDFVVVFAAGKYENPTASARWDTGDWNSDGVFSTTDLVLAFQDGGYEAGPRRAAIVPEPITNPLFAILALLPLVLFGNVRRKVGR